jgi:hypothetical protein
MGYFTSNRETELRGALNSELEQDFYIEQDREAFIVLSIDKADIIKTCHTV